ncbi:MAG: DUF547 domain-containing protein [Candidatus Eisenbacteria bacterium]
MRHASTTTRTRGTIGVRFRRLLVGALAGVVVVAAGTAMARGATDHPSGSPAPARSGAPFDVSGWQRLLDDDLVPLRQYDTDRTAWVAATLFDYRALADEKDWTTRLDTVRAQLLATAPSRLGPTDRLAWAIDTYNFLVIERITREQAARAAAGPALASVQDVKDFFTSPAAEVEGRTYSLEAFEHHFVFLDVDRREDRPLPPGFDARAHFALVGGAIGCPPLWPNAYRGSVLDAQLDSVSLAALHSPSQLRWDPVRRTLEVSELFNWNDHDFGGPDGVMAFLMKHAPAIVTIDLDRYRVATPTGVVPWDWRLNQRP